jgi:hypothetical protein
MTTGRKCEEQAKVGGSSVGLARVQTTEIGGELWGTHLEMIRTNTANDVSVLAAEQGKSLLGRLQSL